MVDFTPASSNVVSIFNMLQNGTAFNTSSLTAAQNVLGQVSGLGQVMSQMSSLTGSAGSLMSGFANGAMSDLTSHLGSQFANLPQNLQVATSALSTALGMGKGDPSNACAGASSMGGGMASQFGSIMGAASGLMGAATSALTGIAGMVGGKVGASVVAGVLSSAGQSGTTSYTNSTGAVVTVQTAPSQAALAALGPLASETALHDALSNLDNPQYLRQLGDALIALGNLDQTSTSQLGATVSSTIEEGKSLVEVGTYINYLADEVEALIASASSSSSSATDTGSSSSGSSSSGGASAGLGQAISAISGVVGQMGGGGLAGLAGNLLSGNLSGAASKAMGMLSGQMGSLGGIMGKVSSLVSGEKAAQAAAAKSLGNAAAAYNLPLLNSNACAQSVLAKAGSPALNKELGNNADGSGGGSGATDNSSPDSTSTPGNNGTNSSIPDGTPTSLENSGVGNLGDNWKGTSTGDTPIFAGTDYGNVGGNSLAGDNVIPGVKADTTPITGTNPDINHPFTTDLPVQGTNDFSTQNFSSNEQLGNVPIVPGDAFRKP